MHVSFGDAEAASTGEGARIVRANSRLLPEEAVLVVVDVQGKLAQLMHAKEELFENIKRMIRGAQILDIPILWVEQNPAGLGPTTAEIAALLPGEPIPKLSFSCCGEERFMGMLGQLSRKQVLLAGIEAHVCIYQTAMDLAALQYEVQIVADAVSSRTARNRDMGLQKAKDGGASLTSVELALFEMVRVAEGARFKEILRIVKTPV